MAGQRLSAAIAATEIVAGEFVTKLQFASGGPGGHQSIFTSTAPHATVHEPLEPVE